MRYFASRGFDLNRHAKALKQIRFLPSQRAEPLAELDVLKYLKHNQRGLLVDTIRESQGMLQRHFREGYESRLQQEWVNSKTQILDHLGTISSVSTTSAQLALPPSKRQKIDGDVRTLEPTKQRYAEATKQFVEAIQKQSKTFQPAGSFTLRLPSSFGYSIHTVLSGYNPFLIVHIFSKSVTLIKTCS